MSKRPTARALAAENPAVNPVQLRKYRALLRDLRRAGVRPTQYSLLSPFTRLPLRQEKAGEPSDPRSVLIRG
jgi:hypothetical protein